MEQLGEQVIHVLRPAPPVGARPALRPVRVDDFVPRLATRLLVLQATPFCNIDCSYCYLPQRNERARMSMHTLQLAARHLRQDGLLADGEITVVWHAGEPLVLPPAWYEDAFAVIAAELGPGVRVQHAMQTNATLIDDTWCRFFLQHAVQLGVSVDGPAALHDLHRRTRRGQGSHAAVRRGLARLRAHAVSFHAIAVVSAATLADPAAFCDWFEAEGISALGCNFDEAEGAHTTSSLAGHEAAHGRFVQHLLQRMQQGRLQLRELNAAEHLLRQPLPRWRWQGHGNDWPLNTQTMPLALITVGHNGDFGSFSPELLGQRWPAFDHFVLGNVHTGSYLDALCGPAFARLWQDIADGITACERECAHFDFCGGGAPVNKLYEHGSFAATETLYCRTMLKRPFDAVLQQAERQQGLAA